MSQLFDQLSGNLLDLGFKNKLINFKDQKLRSIEIIEPDSEEIFSFLIHDKNLYFSKADEERAEEQGIPLDQVIASPRSSNEIIAYKKGDKFERILKNLRRVNNTSQSEKGISVLYAIFGLLNWRDPNYTKGDVKSPLLLIPVTIEFNKLVQRYYMRRSDDEVFVNLSLKSKLDLEQKIVLPDFIEGQDTCESYLSKVEEVVSKKEWSVDNKSYLGIFSFAKMTMYNDLKLNATRMEANPLIDSIYNQKGNPISSNFETNYDEYFNSGSDVRLHNVINADSSQIEAIIEAKNLKSFVIQGPPGTGKSQTITNIIAELIHDKKKVLFVSEKKAALDVVFNNLKKVNLDSYCFQVHSDKMNKKEFVKEIYDSFVRSSYVYHDRSEFLKTINETKAKLDNYCSVLYENVAPLNLRIVDLIDRLYEFRKYKKLDYVFNDLRSLDYIYFQKSIDLLKNYGASKDTIDPNMMVWSGFKPEKFEYQNRFAIKETFENALDYLKKLLDVSEKLSEHLNLGYSTVESAINTADRIKSFEDVPYFDHTILVEDKRRRLIKSLSALNELYCEDYKNKQEIFAFFNADFENVDVEKYKKLFLEDFKGVFRSFKPKYKEARKYILSFSNDSKSKLNYHEICNYLDKLSVVQNCRDKISSVLDGIYSLTSYGYKLSEHEDVFKVLSDLGNFEKKYPDLDVQVINDEVVKDLHNIAIEFANLVSQENVAKYRELQSFFFEDYFAINHKKITEVVEKLSNCLLRFDLLPQWIRYCDIWLPIEKSKLDGFVKYANNAGVAKEELHEAFAYCFYKAWFLSLYYAKNELRYFRRATQDLAVDQFKKKDNESFGVNIEHIVNTVNMVKSRSKVLTKYQYQFGTLSHEANKKRAIKPIRQLFKEISELIMVAKPCLLMSPLSVATYLDYDYMSFDVVIFDEASQIFPWDAIGAIARAKATIVVGDSKQMPPTNFFMSSSDVEDYDDEEDSTDYESILDLCSAVLPQKTLNWHYRSRSESLISFSNKNFYQNRLVTFPSPKKDADDFGITLHFVKNGVFKDRQNVKEAEAVLDLVYENFKNHPERSLGVVCFSINQQALIEDMLEERRAKRDPYAMFFDQNVNEPFFIKNLETVQGDERDTIIFSIGYGKDEEGDLKHNFGPLNRKGGERRLNVAITRAKFNVQIVSSIKGIDIDLNRTKSEGARLLKEYLDLAEHGASPVEEVSVYSDKKQSNIHELKDIQNAVKEAGYDSELRVGFSDFKIDIAVKHPSTGDYFLAIECDGDNYHLSRNARDRDKLRQEVLERMGWSYYRIWSIDWVVNPTDEKNALIKVIKTAAAKYEKEQKEAEARLKESQQKRYEELSKAEAEEAEKERAEVKPAKTESAEEEAEKNNNGDEIESFNNKFFFLIAKAIQGRRVYYRNSKEAAIVNEVLDYVMNDIGSEAVLKKWYANKEEFEQYKYQRRYTYNFYNVSFSLGNIGVYRAKEIYYLFVAAKVTEKIRTYETIFNTKIISDIKKFIIDLSKDIKNNSVSFYKYSELTSNFSNVPESVPFDIIDYYTSFLKKPAN